MRLNIIVNTIVKGFIGEIESNSSSRQYSRKGFTARFISTNTKETLGKEPGSNITLSSKDVVDILSHNNVHVVITLQYEYCDIKRVLINHRSSKNVLFLSAFRGL